MKIKEKETGKVIVFIDDDEVIILDPEHYVVEGDE